MSLSTGTTLRTQGFVAVDAAWTGVMRQRGFWLALSIIVLIATVVRLISAASLPLWWDEAHTLRWATMPVGEMLAETRGTDFNPPLYYLAIAGWVRVFGDSEYALRGVSLLAGAGAVVMIALLGRRLYDARTGLIAAALLAVSWFHTGYSIEARAYAPYMLAATASMYLLAGLLDRFRWSTTIAYAAVSATVVYLHFHGVFIVVAQNAFVVILLLAGRRGGGGASGGLTWTRWIVAQAILGALVFPVALLALSRAGQSGDAHRWLGVPSLGTLIETCAQLAGTRRLLAAFSVLGLVAIALVPRRDVESGDDEQKPHAPWRWRAAGGLLATWAVLAHLLPFALSRWVTPLYHPRYVIGSLPAILLLAAAGLGVLTRLPRPWALLGIGATAVLVAMGTTPLADGRARWRGDPHWPDVVRAIEARALPGDRVYFFSHAPGAGQDLFRYYSTRTDIDVRALPTAMLRVTDAMAQDLARPLVGERRFWLIRSHHFDRRDNHFYNRVSGQFQTLSAWNYGHDGAPPDQKRHDVTLFTRPEGE